MTEEKFCILNQEDLDHYMKINSHILRRLARVTVKKIPEVNEWVKAPGGGLRLKTTPEKYLISSMNAYWKNAVTLANIIHRDKPYCRVCDSEFETGDEVEILRSKISSEAERARTGGNIRIRWVHKKCGEELEDVPPPTPKIGNVKGARSLIISVVPLKDERTGWISESELYAHIFKFFPGSKESAILSEMKKFVAKYQNRLYIEGADKSGEKKYRWRTKRPWMSKKDRLDYQPYVGTL